MKGAGEIGHGEVQDVVIALQIFHRCLVRCECARQQRSDHVRIKQALLQIRAGGEIGLIRGRTLAAICLAQLYRQEYQGDANCNRPDRFAYRTYGVPVDDNSSVLRANALPGL